VTNQNQNQAFFTESGSSPPSAAPRRPRTFPVYSANTAAHLVVLGYDLTLAPSPATRWGLVWLAPDDAEPAARKFTTMMRLLGDDRNAQSDALRAAQRGDRP